MVQSYSPDCANMHTSLTHASRMASQFVWPFFLHSSRQRVSVLYNQPPVLLKIVSLHRGIWTPSSTLCPGPIPLSIPNGISIGSAVFAQLIAQCPIIYNGPPLPPQNCPPHGVFGPHLIRGCSVKTNLISPVKLIVSLYFIVNLMAPIVNYLNTMK